jgi:hypothetical protein
VKKQLQHNANLRQYISDCENSRTTLQGGVSEGHERLQQLVEEARTLHQRAAQIVNLEHQQQHQQPQHHQQQQLVRHCSTLRHWHDIIECAPLISWPAAGSRTAAASASGSSRGT